MVGALLLLPLCAALAHALRVPRMPLAQKVAPPYLVPVDRNGTELPPLDTVYYFDQLIDHNNPSLGTFQQRYWQTWEYYEPGGPIIITTPGEQDADGFEGFLTNATIDGLIAQQQGGATIVLEHRYYGLSNPYNNLSVASLQYHTIQQAIDDFDYFAYNVELAMPGGDHVTPNEAPWVLIGGSYAGALTSFTKVNKPDLFWAAWASSGVVESIVNYWGYFDIIRKHMPQNCSSDVQAVIGYIDDVFTSGNIQEINSIKTTFGMNLSHLDDFVSALSYPIFYWQDLQPSPELTDLSFFEFCDALEVKDGVNAPTEGWGLDYALQAWGSWWENDFLPSACEGQTIEECLGSYDANATYYTDISVNNADRSWMWIVCNYMGFFQDGAPAGNPTIVSRLIEPIYTERQCTYYFPEAFSSPPTPQVTWMNWEYEGWNVQSDRLFFGNGQRDPWRDATVSADNTSFPSTAWQEIEVGDGFHCSEMYTVNGQVDPTIAKVQEEGLAAMKGWLETWTPPSQ
ncbi:uncharacterized protein FIBRA_03598 [Fibroporia radiculosa]|uniref:Peptidase S28 n=1 Tax=Fibroporia radiculosa TaxID=599839 RepID=J4HW29_9APHY|nr:uncharacterized protein FIBRA_03598 [Fibroporia radiculosa]CCM01542.1 predicted protein [Fibroporia radiculosa]